MSKRNDSSCYKSVILEVGCYTTIDNQKSLLGGSLTGSAFATPTITLVLLLSVLEEGGGGERGRGEDEDR